MTDAALGLISQLVVMFTADGKSFVALSVMLVRLCVAPELTTTVNDVALAALNDTVAPFDVRPACTDAVRGKDRKRCYGDGKGAESTHAGGTLRRVTGQRRVRMSLCWSSLAGLIRLLRPRP